MNKILHIFPPAFHKKTGVYQYNYFFFNLLKFKKYRIKKIYYKKKNKIFRYIFQYILIFNLIVKKYKKNITNIILPEEGYLILGFFLKIIGFKVFCIVHDYRKFKDFKKLKYAEKIKILYLEINYLFLRFIDCLIVPSLTTQKKIQKDFRKNKIKIIVVYNLFRLDKNNYYKKEKFLSISNIKKKYNLTVSTSDSYKNLDIIIKLSKEYKNINFVIVLKNNNNSNYKKIKKEERINKNIIIFENINNLFLNSLYKYCDLYISPSTFEGFNRTNIEAQIFKKKIICSKIMINKEILNNSAFYVKKFHDKDSWIKTINKSKIVNKKKEIKKNVKKYLLNKKTKFNYFLFNNI